jgi:signal transduction histidine kinase
MEPAAASTPFGPPPSVEAVTRCVRHEVGDLLQTVYAAVAIMKERLPEEAVMERELLANLRARGERTRHLLDTVHDLVAPIPFAPAPTNLSDLTANLAVTTAVSHPHVALHTDITPTPPVHGDVERLTQLGGLLLNYACQASKGTVHLRVRFEPARSEVEWVLRSEGGSIPEDHLNAIAAPFGGSGPPGQRLMLALAARLARLHGGQFTAWNQQGDGFALRVVFPVR